MLRNAKITLSMLAVATLAASPALAQSGPGSDTGEGRLANGAFELTLNGEVPADMSFYIEANFGSGSGVICTTDAPMVRAGYRECAGNGAVNDMPFVAPAGHAIEYRVLGSRGVELSQVVVAEGSEVAADGLVIESSYTFPGDFGSSEPVVEGEPAIENTPAADAQPVAEEVSAEDNIASVVHDQYEDSGVEAGDDDVFASPEPAPSKDSASDEAITEIPADTSKGALKILPNTGGAPTLLLAGGALLATIGGFAFRKML